MANQMVQRFYHLFDMKDLLHKTGSLNFDDKADSLCWKFIFPNDPYSKGQLDVLCSYLTVVDGVPTYAYYETEGDELILRIYQRE